MKVTISGENGEDEVVDVPIWNGTVANIVLMSLGGRPSLSTTQTSAPSLVRIHRDTVLWLVEKHIKTLLHMWLNMLLRHFWFFFKGFGPFWYCLWLFFLLDDLGKVWLSVDFFRSSKLNEELPKCVINKGCYSKFLLLCFGCYSIFIFKNQPIFHYYYINIMSVHECTSSYMNNIKDFMSTNSLLQF